ncbi:hypothetical protein PTTG_26901 [Puccinia triticina 1-1 BBBD Race 1]|uniref:Zn(2)-C6 fungal-type domain-containing protein n=2 Tax=Puccinia triticina TaxID=208348 RepID=A0A180GPR1_PUCT1|nr:uncharacterized protein PtA15_12A251 [Puccinia triticina]OAV94675.1 hypothetical protein PTTG_26901 [Puccinia triticina 1-1 BBBD Race 1]WAQ90263.1 hypothetical protein PtA15_12A251 [Puccinia triticina]WAR61572.1 hypothetical protein PtB15_12B262 [Puccinia triticina]
MYECMQGRPEMSFNADQPVQDQPKRRRYRIPRSCDRCRISKVKCVLENDGCNNCARLGVSCTFANPGSLQARPPTVKDLDQLTARIRSLERLLHAVDPTLDLNDLPDPNKLVSQSRGALKLAAQSPAESSSHSVIRSAQTSAQHPYQSQLSAVIAEIHGVEATNPPVTRNHWTRSDKSQPMSKCIGVTISPDQYIGPNSGLSIVDPAAFGIPVTPSWGVGALHPVDEYLRLRYEEYVSSTRCFYPEPDLELDLLKIYFQHFHPLVPIVHPATFYHLHKSGLAETDRTFRSLCLIMFSIASRWSMDPRLQFDLSGRPQPCRQFAGMPYGYAGYIGLFQPGYDRTSLLHLQAFVLLTIASLGALQPTATWLLAEQGLLRAQECGAHREVHYLWNADPLQDYLRRQAFFQLYELNHRVSNALNRSPLLHQDDFDLEPAHVERGDLLGIFVNPYSTISPAIHDACVAFDGVRVLLLQLGHLRSMLPLLLQMQASTKASKGAGSIKSLKGLVDQLDVNACKLFDKVPAIFKRPDIESSAEMLMFSVTAMTCYQRFQLLIHQTLFHYQDDQPDRKTLNINPHINRCVEFAISTIQAINKLRLRKLLMAGFYWLPTDLISTVVVLACSIRKQRKLISPHENQVRRDNILLAIAVLDDLASEIHTAAAYSKMSNIMYNLLDTENPSVIDSLKSPAEEHQDGNQRSSLSSPVDSPTVSTLAPISSYSYSTNHMTTGENDLRDYDRKNSWDPLEISAVTYDAAALDHPFYNPHLPPPNCVPTFLA